MGTLRDSSGGAFLPMPHATAQLLGWSDVRATVQNSGTVDHCVMARGLHIMPWIRAAEVAGQ
jgi:hypothetical protein